MTNHAWCRDVCRDEFARAAEDGRRGRLPTLEEAIAAITNHDAPPGARVSESPCAGHADTGADTAGTGLRTERVTLEVTHDIDAPLGVWIVQVIDESLGFNESVRVVEESAPPARGWLTEEEREAVEWFCGSPKAISTEQCDRWKDALRALLARSSPPEVERPGSQVRYHSMSVEDQRDAQWIAALADAGVKVTEGNR